jgi:hypothetical protein
MQRSYLLSAALGPGHRVGTRSTNGSPNTTRRRIFRLSGSSPGFPRRVLS